MRFFDPHIHMTSRTTDDLEAMARAGVRAIVEPAFWLGQPRTQVGSYIDYFNSRLGWERFRAAQFGIAHYCAIGLNSKEANNEKLAREVLELIPYYALKEGVASRFLPISASGFDPYRVIIANKRLVERHPELVAKFSRGAYLGWQSYFANPVPVHEHIGRISPSMEPDGMRYSYVKMRELRLVEGDAAQGESMGAVDLTRWARLGDVLKDLGVVASVPPIGSVVTDAFSPRALGVEPALGPWYWTNAPVQRRQP
jgi:hypothetical protein